MKDLAITITLLFISCCLSVVLCSATAFSEEVTYSVDLSGNAWDDPTGHLLELKGTITAETATNLITGSDLTIFHEGTAVTTFPSLPNNSFGTEPNLIATPTDLWVDTASGDGSISWRKAELFSGFQSQSVFVLGTVSDAEIQINFDLADCPFLTCHSDAVFLSPEPSETLFLIGRAVPEPTAFALLIMGVATTGFLRRSHRGTGRRR